MRSNHPAGARFLFFAKQNSKLLIEVSRRLGRLPGIEQGHRSLQGFKLLTAFSTGVDMCACGDAGWRRLDRAGDPEVRIGSHGSS